MNCPECGHTKSSVRSTVRDGDAVKRYRECVQCKANFPTFESYEKADVEAAFDAGEALTLIERATPLLVRASHIPIVREACSMVRRSGDLLKTVR